MVRGSAGWNKRIRPPRGGIVDAYVYGTAEALGFVEQRCQNRSVSEVGLISSRSRTYSMQTRDQHHATKWTRIDDTIDIPYYTSPRDRQT
jgi:hypothetical protein